MDNPVMKKIAKFIVEKRVWIMLAFAAMLVFCALSVNKVRVNSDIASLLPEDTMTRKAVIVMDEEFSDYAMANIMISNITYEKSEELKNKIEKIDNVSGVAFDDTARHYTSASAFLIVTFPQGDNDPKSVTAMNEIQDLLQGYDVSISSQVGFDEVKEIASQMGMILLCAVIVIIGVMLFTSKSYFEVVIMMIVFAVAALLNMGTNYWFGEISSITNSVAVILQLALAIDYAIIFCHRFQNEYEKQQAVKPALIDSLAHSIIEISSSSLTTIAGLAALTLMQLRLGYDLGMVLIKGIICSLLTVFLLMPGLIMIFHKPLLKTRHKNLVPDLTKWGKILTKKVPVFLIIFAVLLPFAIFASSKCEYSFSDECTDRITYSDRDLVNQRIHNTFEETSFIVVIVPKGEYEKEKLLLEDIESMDHVVNAVGLSNVRIDGDRVLTDSYTVRDFAELTNLDIETAELLYALYGYEHEQYQPILGDRENFAVPLLDMLEFMFESIDKGMVTLGEEQMKELEEIRSTIHDATYQLRGTDHVRMLVEAAVSVEDEEAYALSDKILAAGQELYGDDVLVAGTITSAKDLEESFKSDNVMVTLMTILFVFLVLMIAFRSVGGSILLILMIQGSIWLNFSFPLIQGRNIFFVAYLIVSAIQMGATIDYAIVVYNRFRIQKQFCPPKEAMIKAINESFATVLTSGTIMMAAGFLIAYMTTDIYVASIGLALGRGVLISMILVLTVLPQLLLFGNKFIEKTTINFKKLLGGDADVRND